jgi:hypothetical protein
MLDRELLVSWNIAMVGNTIVGPNVSFFCSELHISPSVFPPHKLGWLFGVVE